MEKRKSILASAKDAEILIEAILNPKPPSQALKDSFDQFQFYGISTARICLSDDVVY